MSDKSGLLVPEWMKNVLIVLLSVSALWLFSLSPLYLNSPMREWLNRSTAPGSDPPAEVTFLSAALPVRMAITNASGQRYGLQYNPVDVDALYEQTSSLLGAALGSAEPPRAVAEERWQSALSGEGIYFDFSGSIPLSALGEWLSAGENSLQFTAQARRVVLAPGDGEEVWLFYQTPRMPALALGARSAGTETQCFACPTALRVRDHLSPLTAAFAPNGAKFAFEDESLNGCSPYTLFTGGMEAAPVYTSSSPLTGGGTALKQTLSALSFSGALVASYTSDEGTVYRLGEDTLLLTGSGTLHYRGRDGALYPVTRKGEEPTLAEMVESTRRLAFNALSPLCGEARPYLLSANEDGEETVITYAYSLNGATLWVGEDGWCAQFQLTGGRVTGYTLRLRSYQATGETQPLLPAPQAAAILGGLSASGRELQLSYLDVGGGVFAKWTAE